MPRPVPHAVSGGAEAEIDSTAEDAARRRYSQRLSTSGSRPNGVRLAVGGFHARGHETAIACKGIRPRLTSFGALVSTATSARKAILVVRTPEEHNKLHIAVARGLAPEWRSPAVEKAAGPGLRVSSTNSTVFASTRSTHRRAAQLCAVSATRRSYERLGRGGRAYWNPHGGRMATHRTAGVARWMSYIGGTAGSSVTRPAAESVSGSVSASVGTSLD